MEYSFIRQCLLKSCGSEELFYKGQTLGHNSTENKMTYTNSHDDRGPIIESIVSRTIRKSKTTHEIIQLVELFATLPNYEDVSLFLRVKSVGLFS